MPQHNGKTGSPTLILLAFATVYIVWGSTYFFIEVAVRGGIPPFMLGAIRFLTGGVILLVWCYFKGERLFILKNIFHATISGLLLLFMGIGAVIWAEQTLPGGMVAIMVSTPPLLMIVLDKPNWRYNFSSKTVLLGLLLGFAGIVALFSEQLTSPSAGLSKTRLPALIVLAVGTVAWSMGSLYSKYKLTDGSAGVTTGWQMLTGGLIFSLAAYFHHELLIFRPWEIPMSSYLSVIYLIVFGSVAAFSAYTWLLQVRPATQVSTYAYVNPVIAILLGVFFANERVSWVQLSGLATILISVMLISLAKSRKEKVALQTR